MLDVYVNGIFISYIYTAWYGLCHLNNNRLRGGVEGSFGPRGFRSQRCEVIRLSCPRVSETLRRDSATSHPTPCLLHCNLWHPRVPPAKEKAFAVVPISLSRETPDHISAHCFVLSLLCTGKGGLKQIPPMCFVGCEVLGSSNRAEGRGVPNL